MRLVKYLILPCIVLCVAAAGLFSGHQLTQLALQSPSFKKTPLNSEPEDSPPVTLSSPERRIESFELFQKVLHLVEQNYVDEVKYQDLIFGAIEGVMARLDPHSNFLSPELFRSLNEGAKGEFGGVGMTVGVRDGLITVIAPMEDSPAQKQGVKAFDRIVKINGESTKGMSLSEAISKIKGKKGTTVKLTLYRDGKKKFKDVVIVRDIVQIKAVRHAVIENGYGYVRISTFSQSTSAELDRALKSLEKDGPLKGLVLDLRDTPGGLLSQAVEVSSTFIDRGVIVSTIGRHQNQKEVLHALRGKARKHFQLGVLVNASTASAAEIVAGAIQDHRRGIVLGTRTFGKGSVQTVVPLGEKMGVKLTVARYYTPNNRSIQGEGLEPDITLEVYDPDLLDKARITGGSLREKDLEGALEGQNTDYTVKELDKDKAEDSSDDLYDPKKDHQVKSAVKILKAQVILKKASE